MAFTGCGDADQPGALPKVTTYPVKGQVLLRDGKPLSEGLVVLVPEQPGGRFPSGPVAPDGTFTLATKDCGEGAPEGRYTVKIESSVAGQARKKGPTRYAVPEKYRDEVSSDLKVTVKPEPNELDPFRLK